MGEFAMADDVNRYSVIRRLITDEKMWNNFISIVRNVHNSKMLNDLKDFLADSNFALVTVPDRHKIALVSLMIKYYSICGVWLIGKNDLDKLLECGKIVIYKIDAPLGLRVATISEVKNGVRGLLPTYTYPIGYDKYKLLCLLMWTITGLRKYYAEAGFKCRYGPDGKCIDTIYDMIFRCADSLEKLFEWHMNKEEFDADMIKLRSLIKHKEYQYPQFARDEVKEDLTVKQLLYYLENNVPKKSGNVKYNKALYLLISRKQYNRELTPGDISFLREVYHELQEDIAAQSAREAKRLKLKEECEQLLTAREQGLVPYDHFAFKIISTLKRNNYSKCSNKQYEIIRDALGLMRKNAGKPQNSVEIIDEIPDVDDVVEELVDISNALGNGEYEFDENITLDDLLDKMR